MIRGSQRRTGGSAYEPAQFFRYSFLSALPAAFTYTRNDTTATRRNNSGNMVACTANQVRFNHTVAGLPLGILIESARTNLFTNFSAVPVATTGFTASGGTLSLTTDATALTTAKLNTLVTGNVFSFVNGSGSTQTVDFPGTTGSTSNCSFSVWARITAGTSCTLTHTGTSPGTTTISGATWQRFVLQNQTISATTVQMRLSVPTGTTVLFILPQIEVGAFCTSEIVTAGATAARVKDLLQCTNLSLLEYYSPNEGTAVIDLDFSEINLHATSTAIILCNGTGLTNLTSVYAITGRSKAANRVFVNSITQSPFDITGIDKTNTRYPISTAWKNGVEFTQTAGAGAFLNLKVTAPWSVNPDRLVLGSRPLAEEIHGHVKSLTIFNKYLLPSQIPAEYVKSGENVVFTCGQSNMKGWFASQVGSNNTGQKSATAVLDAFYPNTRNWMMDGATNATAVRINGTTSTAANAWISEITGEIGEPLRRYEEIAAACAAGNVLAIIDASGESDAGQGTIAEYKAAQLAKWDRMGAGPLRPVIQIPVGRRTAAQDVMQSIREAQRQLAAENPTFVYMAPEKIDLDLVDVVHLTDAAYGTNATRTMRKLMSVLGQAVAGGIDGPTITGVTRVSSTVYDVTMTHQGGGTDFTPTSAISGFRFFDNLTERTISTAVRQSATVIRLTLAVAATDLNQTLYYGYGSLSTMVQANLVKDNTAEALPLKTATCISTNTGGSWTIS